MLCRIRFDAPPIVFSKKSAFDRLPMHPHGQRPTSGRTSQSGVDGIEVDVMLAPN
jgi:hypothetical protein